MCAGSLPGHHLLCVSDLPGSTQNHVHPITPSICFYHCAFFAHVFPSSIAIMNQEIYAQHWPTWVLVWTSRPSSRFESERLERLDLFNASNGEKLDIPVRVTGGSFPEALRQLRRRGHKMCQRSWHMMTEI